MTSPRWHFIEQRSDEWRALRAGKVTASRIADLTAQTKTGWGASRANYAAELVLERLTGVVSEGYTNEAMRYGTEKEPEARSAYCFMRDCAVSEVGFVEHPSIQDAGCSPDGCVGDVGLIEIKVPNPATHLQTLLSKDIDGKYIKQIQFQLAVTERSWCDYVSYRPDFPAPMQLFVKRVLRDDKVIAELNGQVETFLKEILETVSKLKTQYL